MSTHFKRNKVNIFGHKNPDTDSICSAISYCWYKEQTDPEHTFEARRCGNVNRESQYVLDYWKMPTPRLCTSVSPQVKDIDFRLEPGINAEMSLRDAWHLMQERDIESFCITDEDNNLGGVLSITDIMNANMQLHNNTVLSDAKTT